MTGTGRRPSSDEDHRVVVHLDQLLAERNMTLTELAERVGISIVNMSKLKNGHVRSIRFNTLTAVCDALGCQPADLLTVRPARSTGSKPHHET